MPKPGYQTTEHALTWAVVALGCVAMFKDHAAPDRLTSLLAPAIASAAYSLSRGRAKSAVPLARPDLGRQLAEAFRGRVVK